MAKWPNKPEQNARLLRRRVLTYTPPSAQIKAMWTKVRTQCFESVDEISKKKKKKNQIKLDLFSNIKDQ